MIGRSARFCSSCGAVVVRAAGPPTLDGQRLVDPTAGHVDVVTARPGAAASPGADGRHGVSHDWLRSASTWWGRVRNRSLVAVTTCGILLGVAVGLAFATGGSFGTGARATPTTRPVRAPASAPRVATAAPPALGTTSPGSFVATLESILQQAASGHAELVTALTSVHAECPAGAFVASQELAGVMSNRATVLRELAALPVAADGESAVRDALVQALQASAAADAHYEAWAASLASAGCQADAAAPDYVAAQQADATATAYKTEFVNGFNPIAAGAGLSTWGPADF
ncbi:MAG TPA: hypothetical protein VI462_09225 [Acidimicrobiia bacterium]